jgi:2-hydroxychromene-2-carboxylate isomerase
MAVVIDLDAARRARGPATFAFDLASPWTYLAAPAVAERFPEARWVPALAGGLGGRRERQRASRAAERLGLRFAWPAGGRPDGTIAARAASFAAEHGRARAFALAAARLAWGSGGDLDDHALVAQAAGVAELPLDAVLEATFDPRRDAALRASAAGGAPLLAGAGAALDGPALVAGQTSSMRTISVASLRRGPSFRMRV